MRTVGLGLEFVKVEAGVGEFSANLAGQRAGGGALSFDGDADGTGLYFCF